MGKAVAILLLIVGIIVLGIGFPDAMMQVCLGIVGILILASFGWFLLKIFGGSG